MSIYVYVLKHNPEGAYDMIRKYGFAVSKDSSQNVDKLKNIVRQFGDEALSEIASIHPDRDLILSHAESLQSKDKKSNACGGEGDEFSNCDGDKKCSCSCNKKSNAEGESEQEKVIVQKGLPIKSENSTPNKTHKTGIDKGMLVLLGSIVLLSAIFINSKSR